MAAELVNSATSDKLAEMDWMKNIQICELVAHDQKATKDVVKAIKKRIESTNPNTQLYAVLLLEMLMNNIGERIHEQVVQSKVLPILVKIVKKKTDFPVRERIFLLLDATQTSLGGSSGKFPQYYSAYYDLVSAGVKFPQRPQAAASDRPNTQAGTNNRQAPSSQANENARSIPEVVSSCNNGNTRQPATQPVPESSIIQKASNALEVLKEVLDAVDPQHPVAAKDEFTLDLVEQCSFQKQRVMHLVISSRDEKVISRAIELNEKLQKVLDRHDALVSGRPVTSVNHATNTVPEEEEEEEPEQLFRRMRKGKARANPENEAGSGDRSPRDLYEPSFSIPPERLNRPLRLEPNSNPQPPHPPVTIPPPPAKHVEREKFFMENKLHSRNPSSSRSDSLDFSE